MKKRPKDKQINGSVDDIWPQALIGPGVFGMNVNVKSAVFFIGSETSQSYNICYFLLINVCAFKAVVVKKKASSSCGVLNTYIFLLFFFLD